GGPAAGAARRRRGAGTGALGRGARPSLVLGEPALAARFDTTLDDALAAVGVLESADPGFAASTVEWRASAQRIQARLATASTAPTDPTGIEADTLATAAADTDFAQLTAHSARLATEVERHLARQNQAVMDALDHERST